NQDFEMPEPGFGHEAIEQNFGRNGHIAFTYT
ncbi:MAG: hypothetical protein RL706_912, partial [Pseudomonadota bacterium]